jgi:NADP-dependent 3-hydroxy acid dehydrogenase YdfG
MKLLLIGMGPGMGYSIAKRFGQAGFDILMLARNAEKLSAYESELAQLGIRAKGYAADLADHKSLATLLQSVVSEQPDIEIMHYNASAYNPALPSAIDLNVFLDDLNVNITGALLAAQAVMPQMRARGKGTLFMTGGGTAFDAPPELASLGIGKAGMRSLALTLAKECKPLGIHVATITVCGMIKPGTPFDPDLIAGAFWQLYGQEEGQWEVEMIMK